MKRVIETFSDQHNAEVKEAERKVYTICLLPECLQRAVYQKALEDSGF